MKKRCKRKHYPLNGNLIDYVSKGVAVVGGKMLTHLRLVELSMVAAFREDRATLEDYRIACDMVNMCEFMARRGYGLEALVATNSAHLELVDAAKRFERTQRMSLPQPGIKALQDVFDYHDLQRQELTHAEYEKFITDCGNFIRSGAATVERLDVKVPAGAPEPENTSPYATTTERN